MAGCSVGTGNAASGSCVDTNGKTIKVGFINSRSGALAQSATPVEQALTLAASQINDAGGVMGKQLKVIAEDGASTNEVFAERSEKLITKDCVAAVFGGWTSSSRAAMTPIFEKHNALLYYPKTYEGFGTSKNVFYFGATANQQTIPALDFLKAQGKKKIFLVGSDYNGPHSANAIARAYAAENGLEIVGEEYRPVGAVEFADVTEKIRTSGADAVYNTIAGDSNVAFFRQLAYDKMSAATTPVMSWAISESEIEEIGAVYLAGHYTATTYLETMDNPANKEFIAAFKAVYGDDQVTADTMEGAYASLFLWKESVEKAGSFAVDDVRAASDGVSFDAPEGKLTIDGPTQHLFMTPVIGQIQPDGKLTAVWTAPAPVKPDPLLTSYPWAAGIKVDK